MPKFAFVLGKAISERAPNSTEALLGGSMPPASGVPDDNFFNTHLTQVCRGFTKTSPLDAVQMSFKCDGRSARSILTRYTTSGAT